MMGDTVDLFMHLDPGSRTFFSSRLLSNFSKVVRCSLLVFYPLSASSFSYHLLNLDRASHRWLLVGYRMLPVEYSPSCLVLST